MKKQPTNDSWGCRGKLPIISPCLLSALVIGLNFVLAGRIMAQSTAPIPSLYNTGISANNADGTPAALTAQGTVDAHYSIIAGVDGSISPFVTVSSAYPFPAWTADTQTSQWISPRATYAVESQDPVGIYTYETTFDLTGFDLNTVSISGKLTADNAINAVRINGFDIGFSTPGTTYDFTPFAMPDGHYVSGVNQIDIDVANFQPAGGNPSGLRAEINGTGAIAVSAIDVAGQVVCPCDGSPIAGALVQIGTYSATTDSNGNYSLSNIPPGSYTATVSQSNYFTLGNDTGAFTGQPPEVTWSFALYPRSDILSQPLSQSVKAGATATFTIATKCSTADSYQWLFNGANLVDDGRIVGTLTDSLSISDVQPGDAGGYSVLVIDQGVPGTLGAVTSSVATLGVLDASPINLYSTGLDDQFRPLAPESLDPHYVIISAPPGTESTPFTPYVVDKDGYPFSAGRWLADDAASQWLGRQPRYVSTPDPGGDYDYRTTFDLDGRDPASAAITFRFIADNSMQDVLINGRSAGLVLPPIQDNSLVSWSGWFVISNNLTAGANTLDFIVNNLVAAGVNPSGLRVEMSGYATTLGIPPAITMPPASQTNVVGEPATFSVVATGTAPLWYQWSFDGNSVAGATNSTYSMASIQVSDGGSYAVTVTNSAGGVTSAAATLTVLVPPRIVSLPTDQAVIVGGTTRFQVEAVGSGPLSYQWFVVGSDVVIGATNATLTLTNVQMAQAGNYAVRVSNLAGSTNSLAAQLTVLAPPTITRQPQAQIVAIGGSPCFSVHAFGTPPLSYQWQFNGNPLAGQTNSMLCLSGVSTNDAGTYNVVVANAAGTAVSSNAGLTVLMPPSVSIIQPTNHASFQAGLNLMLVAEASDPFGAVTQVEFFLSGTNALGLATNSPYTFIWINAPAGACSLTAVATGGGGLMSTSAPVNITLTNPASPALAVALTAPPNGAAFCLGNNVLLTASVTNAQAGAAVEFYAGATLLGRAASAPYQYEWPFPQVGIYALSARVTGVEGQSAVSTKEVSIVVAPQCSQVAIVRAAPDPEIDTLQAYLLQMRLGSQVFDQAGLSTNLLSGFELVIWDDVGKATNGLTANTVDVLNHVYAGGKPLYLIGEHLVSAAANLPSTQQTNWMNLTHLGAASGCAGNGMISIDDPEGANNPVLCGQFWTVTNFVYPGPFEGATTNDSVSETLLQGCGANAVLVVYPPVSAPGPTPVVAQDLRVLPPNGSTAAVDVLEGLFKNAVCWLTHCENCQDVGLGLTGSQTNEVVAAGQPLSYTLLASCNGECPPVGVTLTNYLQPGFVFLGATNTQGNWNYDPVLRVVVFFIGLMPQDGTLEFQVTVEPTQAGTFTNQAVISLSLGDTNKSWTLEPPMAVTVLPGTNAAPALLGVRLVRPSGLELSLSGQPGTTYQVEYSTNLRRWDPLTNVLGPTWTHLFLPGPGTNGTRQFFRAPASP